ncbi:MAG: transposase [Aggregatilineales bacterium]
MNAPKVDELDYINFLIAAQRVFSTVEVAKVSPDEMRQPAHDAYTRLLQRTPPDSNMALWREVDPLVKRKSDVLMVDDSTLDKPYARHMALLTRHWSGKHHQVVQGINLVSLVWSDGEARLPCDFRLHNKDQDGLSKNDHFQHMIAQAHERGFEPEVVALDSWYASLPNIKLIRDYHWHWLTQLKSNRQVSVDRSGNRAISGLIIPVNGLIVHLKGYAWIKVFRTVGTNGNPEYWATNQLDMTIQQAADYALDAWQIEVYHRGLKQFTGIERGQFRLEIAQGNHIGFAIRAFVRLEAHRLQRQLSYFESKTDIIRDVIRAYLAHPTLVLQPTA